VRSTHPFVKPHAEKQSFFVKPYFVKHPLFAKPLLVNRLSKEPQP
jgi:hypothetical protein